MPVLRRCNCRGYALALACAVVLAVLVDTTNGSAGLPATAGAGAGLAGAGNMGLRGSKKGRDQDSRRKPYDENKEPGDVILKDWKKKVANPPTALESLLAEMLLKYSSEDRCVRIDV